MIILMSLATSVRLEEKQEKVIQGEFFDIFINY